VIVVGCGRVGSELVRRLTDAGHAVTVVDKDSSALSLLDDLEVPTVVGFGFDADTLTAAGIDGCDAVAAVTSGDNSNILIARIAREQFGVEHVVARIQEPARAAIYQRLGVSTVATVTWTTDQLLRRLLADAPRTDWVDASGSICLVERDLPDSLVGRPVVELSSAGELSVVAVSRMGECLLVTPDLLGQAGDVLHVMARPERAADLDAELAGEVVA
jgi:trk system potassium uptake protein TrkA